MYLLYSALAIAEWEMESINKQYKVPTQPGNVISVCVESKNALFMDVQMRRREKKPAMKRQQLVNKHASRPKGVRTKY